MHHQVAPDDTGTILAGTKYFSHVAIPFAVFITVFFIPSTATALAVSPKPLTIVSAMPGVSAAETAIASEDGTELYIFQGGRHLRTLDAHNGIVKYLFAYDARGHLASVTDADGNVITVQRDAQGKPLAIVAPDGQKTTLALDANGYLASIADPAGNTATYTYDVLGLMATYTDARGGAYAFTYDTLGRLTKDTNPAGGLWALVRAETALGHSVTMTSAEGRGKTYLAEKPKAGGEVITNTGPDGLKTTKITGTDGVVTTTMPDGTINTAKEGPDPRFGMQSPLTASQTVKTPSGLTYAASEAKAAVLTAATDPLSLTKETATTTVNGKTYTTVYDNTLKKVTATSPAGRQNIALLDAKGKVTKSQTPGLADVNYASKSQLSGFALSLRY